MPRSIYSLSNHEDAAPTFGQITLELSGLLIKEEMGQTLSMDDQRRKASLMMQMQHMIQEQRAIANIGEFVNDENNIPGFGNMRRRSRRARRAPKRHRNE
jgi:hypothetical protein